MNVAIYLRKSRADVEAEKRGEGETLAKHKKALLELAKQKKLNVLKVYEEIASGESLIHRPEMMKLLKEVEKGLYEAVVCMDLDRLGRGNMQDQGVILDTFKQSKTKIITPRKVYDLGNEFDEEYSEFEAFMARKELKIINRRLQSGRVRSVKDGNYIGTRPPYGYQIKKDQNGRYLAPDPDQAPAVKLIFDWYTKKRIGSTKIANRLNDLGYKTYTGKLWDTDSVRAILMNPVYIGKVTWRKKKYQPIGPKKRKTKQRPRDEWIVADGKHVPLIDEETFAKAQEIMEARSHPPYKDRFRNPLAGLVFCAKCGYSMVYRPYKNQKDYLVCRYSKRCHTRSTAFEVVEKKLLDALREWLDQYKLQFETKDFSVGEISQIEILKNQIETLQNELKTIDAQMGKLHDLLERGIYDEETFIKRSKVLSDRKEKIHQALVENEELLQKEKKAIRTRKETIPKIEHILDIYNDLDDPKKKNDLLKKVLEKCVYKKERHQVGDDFELTIYPKL